MQALVVRGANAWDRVPAPADHDPLRPDAVGDRVAYGLEHGGVPAGDDELGERPGRLGSKSVHCSASGS